jgi:SAM-dependent methyltransferase
MQDPWSEDLAAQAHRGRELGSALCACDGYYHTLWGSLRIAGVNNTMKGEASTLAELMSPLLRDGMRVMIGGSADPGVLCGIGRIYAPRMPAFTVIDKCRAPLALIDEFASAKGFACRTLHGDLLDLDGTEQWDQIVLHYTVDFMDAHLRGRLFRNMARALVPGGTLICATMTGVSPPSDRRPEMEAAYIARATELLKDTPMAAYASTPEFEHKLRAYAACRTVRRLTLPTPELIGDLAREAGLRVIQTHQTARARRILAGMDVLDTSSVIIASRS